VRDWLKYVDEIDKDCIHRYEYLLGRKLKDYDEYSEIDEQVDDMILEITSRKVFYNMYPELKKYR
jgi:hypothetical protein